MCTLFTHLEATKNSVALLFSFALLQCLYRIHTQLRPRSLLSGACEHQELHYNDIPKFDHVSTIMFNNGQTFACHIKIPKQAMEPGGKFPSLATHIQNIPIDIVGPIRVNRICSYIPSMIDSFT